MPIQKKVWELFKKPSYILLFPYVPLIYIYIYIYICIYIYIYCRPRLFSETKPVKCFKPRSKTGLFYVSRRPTQGHRSISLSESLFLRISFFLYTLSGTGVLNSWEERLHFRICDSRWIPHLSTQYIHIYIYIYVCVCVCVWRGNRNIYVNSWINVYPPRLRCDKKGQILIRVQLLWIRRFPWPVDIRRLNSQSGFLLSYRYEWTWILTKGFCAKWNATSRLQDLNLSRRIYFLRPKPLVRHRINVYVFTHTHTHTHTHTYIYIYIYICRRNLLV